MKDKRKFGSVAWQKEQADEIMRKTIMGEPLNEFDKAFILVQQKRLYGMGKKKLKGVI